jgi:putative tryptophan/tyrosine transport system substrate-binding protein
MRRRTFALGIAVVCLTPESRGEAQQPGTVPRIGILAAPSRAVLSARLDAFRRGLAGGGYIEGKSILIEYRLAEGRLDYLPALAADLLRLKVDVIVSSGPEATRRAKTATAIIPIVMAQDPDPVGNGFVASLARPGGNVTGLSSLSTELTGKQLELLRAIVPKLSDVAVIGQSTQPGNARALSEVERTAELLGLRVQHLDVRSPHDIEQAFGAAKSGRAGAIFVLGGAVAASHRAQIAQLAARARLPAIAQLGEFVEDGGLVSYGVSLVDLWRRAATYIDRILRGARPADLPVEQPTQFELIVNLKAARQIGLTVPPDILARADRVIQ